MQWQYALIVSGITIITVPIVTFLKHKTEIWCKYKRLPKKNKDKNFFIWSALIKENMQGSQLVDPQNELWRCFQLMALKSDYEKIEKFSTHYMNYVKLDWDKSIYDQMIYLGNAKGQKGFLYIKNGRIVAFGLKIKEKNNR